jgi:hypothetical protein
MQNVADMTPPLRPKEGFAARGSISSPEFLLSAIPDRLIRRRIS